MVTFRAFGVKWERYVARRFYGWMAITWRYRVRLAWHLVTDVSPSDWKNPILERGLSIIQCEMAEFHLSPSGTTHQHVTQAPEPLPSCSLKKEMKCPRGPPSRHANIPPILPFLQNFTGLLGATWCKYGCGLRPARFLRSYHLAFMGLGNNMGLFNEQTNGHPLSRGDSCSNECNDVL